MRINKYLASCGIGARRKCEEFVSGGKVRINGQIITDLATQVTEGDVVEFNGKVATPHQENIYIILNKPRGYVTTCDDERGRRTILDLIDNAKLGGALVFPVGRLDYDTEGLLILTNDGDFARAVSHPSSRVEKTYVATVDKAVLTKDLRTLERGVMVDGEMTHPAKVQAITPNRIKLVITQGRNRQVRKMLAALGYTVTHLERTAVGALTLGNLKRGEWTVITKDRL